MKKILLLFVLFSCKGNKTSEILFKVNDDFEVTFDVPNEFSEIRLPFDSIEPLIKFDNFRDYISYYHSSSNYKAFEFDNKKGQLMLYVNDFNKCSCDEIEEHIDIKVKFINETLRTRLYIADSNSISSGVKFQNNYYEFIQVDDLERGGHSKYNSLGYFCIDDRYIVIVNLGYVLKKDISDLEVARKYFFDIMKSIN